MFLLQSAEWAITNINRGCTCCRISSKKIYTECTLIAGWAIKNIQGVLTAGWAKKNIHGVCIYRRVSNKKYTPSVIYCRVSNKKIYTECTLTAGWAIKKYTRRMCTYYKLSWAILNWKQLNIKFCTFQDFFFFRKMKISQF